MKPPFMNQILNTFTCNFKLKFPL